MHSKLRLFSLPISLSLLSVGIWLGGDSVTNALQYDRNLIAAGEFWRVLTAHVTHLGGSHLMLNIAGLVLTFFLFGSLYTSVAWLSLYVVASVAITLGVYLWNTEIVWYVGLSGVLHGFFVAGGLANMKTHRIESTIFLLVVSGKLLWEQLAGPLPGSEESAGGPVLVDAHFYGAVAGLVWFITFRWWRQSGK